MTKSKSPVHKSTPDSPTTPATCAAPPLTWTDERQFDFAVALVDTCDVKSAAEAVGMTEASAYALHRDPEKGNYFRRLWREAIDLAEEELAAELESRAERDAQMRAADIAMAKPYIRRRNAMASRHPWRAWVR